MKKVAGLTMAAVAALALVVGCNKTTTVVSDKGGKPDTAGNTTRTLTVTEDQSVSITKGQTAQVKVSIKRENFTDPVTVKLENLPTGVKVVDEAALKIPSDKTDTSITLKAEDNAAVVSDQKAMMVVTGPGDLKSTGSLKVTVK
jgi:hypothetical protein